MGGVIVTRADISAGTRRIDEAIRLGQKGKCVGCLFQLSMDWVTFIRLNRESVVHEIGGAYEDLVDKTEKVLRLEGRTDEADDYVLGEAFELIGQGLKDEGLDRLLGRFRQVLAQRVPNIQIDIDTLDI